MREDLMSNTAKGISPPDDDPESIRLNDGISVFNTEQQALKKALRYRHLGDYIIVLELPDDAPGVRFERTLRTIGHHTLWGDPDELLKYVVAVVLVA